MGQGQALHGGENRFLQAGILGFQGGNKVFHLLSFGVAVGGAGIVDHRQGQPGGGVPDHGLADVEQGADLGDVGAVQVGHGMKAGQPAFVEQREKKGLHRVVVVVAQGHCVDARLLQGGVEGPPAHFGAQGAGVFLLPCLKDDMVHLGGDAVKGDPQVPAVVVQGGQVHPRCAHVHREGFHRKAPREKPGKAGQRGQQHQGVLPPGHADGDPLAGGDHVIVRHTAAEQAEDFLHGCALLTHKEK